MAEFCLECWNKINNSNDKERKYIMSEELGLCEGCGEWKRVIIAKKRRFHFRRLRPFLFRVRMCFLIVKEIILFPYLFYKFMKDKYL